MLSKDDMLPVAYIPLTIEAKDIKNMPKNFLNQLLDSYVQDISQINDYEELTAFL